MLRRIVIVVVVLGLFLGVLQYLPVLFYAWEFNDFINDEVKFAPMRESDENKHIVDHILEQGRKYGMVLDKNTVQLTKQYHPESGITTLTIDVDYSAPIDFRYFLYQARFHHHASTNY